MNQEISDAKGPSAPPLMFFGGQSSQIETNNLPQQDFGENNNPTPPSSNLDGDVTHYKPPPRVRNLPYKEKQPGVYTFLGEQNSTANSLFIGGSCLGVCLGLVCCFLGSLSLVFLTPLVGLGLIVGPVIFLIGCGVFCIVIALSWGISFFMKRNQIVFDDYNQEITVDSFGAIIPGIQRTEKSYQYTDVNDFQIRATPNRRYHKRMDSTLYNTLMVMKNGEAFICRKDGVIAEAKSLVLNSFLHKKN